MKLVYVAGRYTAKDGRTIEENVADARRVGRQVAAVPGLFPVVPHQLGAGMEDIGDYDYWVQGTLELLRGCHAVCTVPGWEESTGARGEVDEAKRLGMAVVHMDWGDPSEARERLSRLVDVVVIEGGVRRAG